MNEVSTQFILKKTITCTIEDQMTGGQTQVFNNKDSCSVEPHPELSGCVPTLTVRNT